MAHVHSGIAAFSNAMQCLKSPITATKATIDNANWTYFVEIQVGFSTEVIAVKFDY